MKPSARQRAERREREIVQDAHRPDEALRRRGPRAHRRCPGARAVRANAILTALPTQPDLARLGRRDRRTGPAPARCGPSRRVPARPTISPARTVEADVPGHAAGARARAPQAPARRSATDDLGKQVLDAPPDHHLDEFGGVGVGDFARADIGAVAQHRDAVGDLEHLVEPMADVDDADAARLAAAARCRTGASRRSPSAPRSARP